MCKPMVVVEQHRTPNCLSPSCLLAVPLLSGRHSGVCRGVESASGSSGSSFKAGRRHQKTPTLKCSLSFIMTVDLLRNNLAKKKTSQKMRSSGTKADGQCG